MSILPEFGETGGGAWPAWVHGGQSGKGHGGRLSEAMAVPFLGP